MSAITTKKPSPPYGGFEVRDRAWYGQACRLPINVINIRPSSGVLFCFTRLEGGLEGLCPSIRLKNCHNILSRSSYFAILIVNRCVVLCLDHNARDIDVFCALVNRLHSSVRPRQGFHV